ncbi:MAG: polysaccharide deacetylase family protein [Aquihabitans sp.]
MTQPIPILLYHGVDDHAPQGLAPYVMAPERFDQHMARLVQRGCHAVTVSDLCDLIDRGDPVPEETVVVSFDDGLADFGTHAWPILRRHDLPATLYVVTDRIGGEASWLGAFGPPPPMLTWDQLRALDAEGCEIGAHSATHPELDAVPRRDLVDEVRGSRTALALGLGHPVRSFAYPHGYHDRKVKEAARRAGFDSACAVRNMLSSAADDRYAIARVTIEATCDVAGLDRVLDGIGLATAPRRQQLRTVGWRTVRRARRRAATRR